MQNPALIEGEILPAIPVMSFIVIRTGDALRRGEPSTFLIFEAHLNDVHISEAHLICNKSMSYGHTSVL
jgi:hypothetical protein